LEEDYAERLARYKCAVQGGCRRLLLGCEAFPGVERSVAKVENAIFPKTHWSPQVGVLPYGLIKQQHIKIKSGTQENKDEKETPSVSRTTKTGKTLERKSAENRSAISIL
jgi:hypothetical protein